MSAEDFFTAAARYDALMGPIFFTPPARALAARAAAVASSGAPTILEVAAGTGRLTNELKRVFPDATITATDLAPPMLAFAADLRPLPGVEWRQSDAQALDVPDASYDLVLAQFGVMFYPDRVRALREAHRALRDGGTYLQSSWDRVAPGDLDDAAARAVEAISPESARVLRDVIHGYADPGEIEADLRAAGFQTVSVEVLEVDTATTPQAVGEALALGSALQAVLRADGVDPEQAATLMGTEIAATLGIGIDDTTTSVLRILLATAR